MNQSQNLSLDQDYRSLIVNTYESVPKVLSPKESSLFSNSPFKLVSRQQHRTENKYLYLDSKQRNQSPTFIPNEIANRTQEDKIQVKNRFERVHDIISGDVRGQFKFPKIKNGQSLNKYEQNTKVTRYDPFKRNAILQLQNNFIDVTQAEFMHEIDHLKGHQANKRITNRGMYVSEMQQNPDIKFTKLKAKNYVVNPIISSVTIYQQQQNQVPNQEYSYRNKRTQQAEDNENFSFKAQSDQKKLL